MSSDASGGAVPAVGAPPQPAADAEDLPQGQISRRFREQRYAGSGALSTLVQWFAPRPHRQTVMTREEIDAEMPDTMAPEVAAQVVKEAERLEAQRDQQIGSTEAKATTLLGTVAISGSLVIASASLILDAKVGTWGRPVLAIIVSVLLFCLLMCGWIASRAVLHVFALSRPRIRFALKRAEMSDVVEGQRDLAIDLMTRAGRNLYVANYKVAQVRVAYRWYRLALAAFAMLAAAIAGVALW
jgi:hypothetical protein